MSQKYFDNPVNPDDLSSDELERLLEQGISLQDTSSQGREVPQTSSPQGIAPTIDDDESDGIPLAGGKSGGLPTPSSDYQGALGLFAEAAQDMVTAGVELGLGRHFACADYCNSAVEKAAQAVSLLRFGRRSMYNHDLAALGAAVGAPKEIQDAMAILTPFHPETFYADTPPEEADEVISAEQASSYVQTARRILRWARNIVLTADISS